MRIYNAIEALLKLAAQPEKSEIEVLDETVQIIAPYFSKADHYFYSKKGEGENLELIGSTRDDPDEINSIFQHVTRTLKCKTVADELSRSKINEKQVKIIPLQFLGETIGFWAVKAQGKNKNINEKLMRFFSFFLSTFVMNHTLRVNLYLDPLTMVFGRVYFEKIINALIEKKEDVYICAIKLCSMEITSDSRNYSFNDNSLKELAKRMQEGDAGSIYRISGSILGFIAKEKIKSYDYLHECLIEYKDKLELKGLILPVRMVNNLFYDLNLAFQECYPNNISVFGEELKTEKLPVFVIEEEYNRKKETNSMRGS